jgi:hypothetical protein
MQRLFASTVFIAIMCGVAGFNHAAAQNQIVSDEWVRVHVCKMSFLVPKDLKRTNAMGIASCVAEFASDKMGLYLDFGHHSSDKDRVRGILILKSSR